MEQNKIPNKKIVVEFNNESHLDNGILTELTSKVSKKVIGFVQADVKSNDGINYPVLLKSKALQKRKN